MTTGYLDATRVRALAHDLGLRPSKRRGQNFVVDANTVRRIVALAGVGAEDTVLEVGPGLGSLTLGLLATGASVVAVEIEPALARQLPATVASLQPEAAGRLHVVEADALAITPAATPGQPTALVANLPYNVAVPVLLTVLERFPAIVRGLVMVQREVADRLVAGPGSRTYGVPSVKLAWYAAARPAGSVPSTVFWPAPNVESGLVAFERFASPHGDEATRAATFRVIDLAFAGRRKMIRTALSPAYEAAQVARALAEAGIDPTVRGEALAVADFLRLTQALVTGDHQR